MVKEGDLMATVYRKNVIKAVAKSARLIELAEKKAKKEFFQPAVRQMLQEFDEHEITREILDGVDAENISRTLPRSRADHMNLYSFIGFESSEPNPIIKLREMLDPKTALGKRYGPKMEYIRGSRTNEGEYHFLIQGPDKAGIYSETGLPWAPGISWVYRIEQGLPGVGHFLNRETSTPEPSRSGGGVQVTPKVRGGSFRNRSYLSSIFNRFISFAKKGMG